MENNNLLNELLSTVKTSEIINLLNSKNIKDSYIYKDFEKKYTQEELEYPFNYLCKYILKNIYIEEDK